MSSTKIKLTTNIDVNIILRLIKFVKNIAHNKRNNELSNMILPNRFKPIFNNVE